MKRLRRWLKRILSVLVDAGTRFGEDNAPRLGAALAFYTVISIAPLLVVIVGITGQIYGAEAARGEIVAQIEDAVGTEAAVLIEAALQQAHVEGDGRTVAIIGLIGLLIGATTLFVHLKGAMNAIWGVRPKPNTAGIIGAVRALLVERLIVFVLVVGAGLVLITTLLASAVLATIAKFFDDLLPVPSIVLRVADFSISLVLITLVFAYLYRALPDVRLVWREVWFGAAVTAVLFTAGKYLIGLYLGQAAIGSAYGAAGSLVVLLVWVYLSAQIFFFGAEVTQVYATRYGPGWRARRGFVLSKPPTPSEHAGRAEGGA